jgi:rRNA-processing protein FCF1
MCARRCVQIDLVKGMVDCLYAECRPCITACVMAELEKLGQKYRVALKIAKDPRVKKLPCSHKGTYADDCICARVAQHRCYIVATCDKDLRRRIRKARCPRTSLSRVPRPQSCCCDCLLMLPGASGAIGVAFDELVIQKE